MRRKRQRKESKPSGAQLCSRCVHTSCDVGLKPALAAHLVAAELKAARALMDSVE